MDTLFPLRPILPPGFYYEDNFISETEEQQLLEYISALHLKTFNFHGYQAKRKVASYGYDWSFEKKKLSKGKDIPDQFNYLIQKSASATGINQGLIGELLVTEYPIGSVINWHRDAPPFDVIIGISLLNDCIFRFRPYDKQKQKKGSILSLAVKRRSMYVIKNEARSEWEHSIQPAKTTRYSITLRTLKVGLGT